MTLCTLPFSDWVLPVDPANYGVCTVWVCGSSKGLDTKSGDKVSKRLSQIRFGPGAPLLFICVIALKCAEESGNALMQKKLNWPLSVGHCPCNGTRDRSQPPRFRWMGSPLLPFGPWIVRGGRYGWLEDIVETWTKGSRLEICYRASEHSINFSIPSALDRILAVD